METPISWFINPMNYSISTYGYGSIPINTIFRGMNIHLPAILMFTRGTRFWHTAIYTYTIYTDPCSSTSPPATKSIRPRAPSLRSGDPFHPCQDDTLFKAWSRIVAVLVPDPELLQPLGAVVLFVWRFIMFMAWKHYDIWVDYEIWLSMWCHDQYDFMTMYDYIMIIRGSMSHVFITVPLTIAIPLVIMTEFRI